MLKYILFIITIGAVIPATAADNGSGVTNFSGSVIDAPCAIAPEDVDKTVDLGTTTVGYLADNRGSDPVDISIHLINCNLVGAGTDGEDLSKVMVTIDSTAVDPNNTGHLANTDSAGAKNVFASLEQANDMPIGLGGAFEIPLQVTSTEQTITFKAYMSRNASDADLVTPGNFITNATYSLFYM